MAKSNIEITFRPIVAEAFATLTESMGRVAAHQEEIVARQKAIQAEMSSLSTAFAEILQGAFEVVETPLSVD